MKNTRVIKITVTDEDGVVLDHAQACISALANQITVLAHESHLTPNSSHHWIADLAIGSNKQDEYI